MKKNYQCARCAINNRCEQKTEKMTVTLMSCTTTDLQKAAEQKGVTVADIIDMLVADYLCFL